jgi:hypothetical protein
MRVDLVCMVPTHLCVCHQFKPYKPVLACFPSSTRISGVQKCFQIYFDFLGVKVNACIVGFSLTFVFRR